ncbi:MAG: protein phosphatase 2C domain-containing protein [Anaerolineae bacterium]
MGIIFESETNIGNKRQVNEDSLWPKTSHHAHRPDEPYGMLFIIADGMGGHGSGDVASELAITEISTNYYGLGDEVSEIRERLRLAIEAAHQKICQQAADNPALENMGSTVAAAVVKYDEVYEQGEVWVAWAGDSRVYLLRHGHLQQLTRDHSRVWPLIASGQITWDQLRFHPERSRVTNGLTARRTEVIPEIERFDLEPGDQILLCSDGLPGEVRPEQIERTLVSATHEQALPLLIAQANAPKEVLKDGKTVRLEGGNDNISLILINIPTGETTKTAAHLPVTVVSAPVRAKSSRLGWLVGGILVAIILVGAGLFMAIFGLAALNNGIASSASIPPTPLAAAADPLPPTATIQPVITISELEATATLQPTATALPPTPSPEETRLPTSTRGPSPTPLPTSTPIPPTATPVITATPTLTTVIDPAALPPPILIEPQESQEGLTKGQDIRFAWQWPGELRENLGFEIRIWLEGQEPIGAYDVREIKRLLNVPAADHQYFVTLKLDGAGISQTDKNYLWSVGIVELEPYRWLNVASEPRRISIVVPR